jgi:hypothetical protein
VLVSCLARATLIETARGESFITQSLEIAFTALCEIYNPSGHDAFHGRIRPTETANDFNRPVISIGHQLKVSRLKYRAADEFDNRGHNSLRQLLSGRIIPDAPMPVWSKLTTFAWGEAG